MQAKRIMTTNDLVFRKIFASPQNSHILIGFINDILGLDVTEVTIENTYNIKTFYNEKKEGDTRYTQVDVLARLRDGSLVTIEMQVLNQSWLRERILFYTAETYTSNYAKKAQENIDKMMNKNEWKYSSLRPVYSICIMVANEFADEEPIHKFNLYDREHNLSYKNRKGEELMTMVFLELGKSSSKIDKNIGEWFAYFRTGKVSEDAPNYMKQACEIASYQSLEKEEMAMISARERAEQDALAREHYVWTEAMEKGMQQGIEKGIEKGIEQGVAKGIKAVIQKMLESGKSVQEIAEFTGMSKQEIEKVL